MTFAVLAVLAAIIVATAQAADLHVGEAVTEAVKTAKEKEQAEREREFGKACINTKALSAAIDAAAYTWKDPAPGRLLQQDPLELPASLASLRRPSGAQRSLHAAGQKRLVMLTTCDAHCLRELFPPFVYLLEHTRDGDISSRLIVVATGPEAHSLCTAYQKTGHKHQCVLDKICFPLHLDLGHSADHTKQSTKLGKPTYYYALQRKVMWALEVLRLGASVMWTDTDIAYLGDPLKVLLKYPDADWMISPEYWDAGHVFVGPAFKWSTGRAMSQNGGMWLAHPTPGARGIMEVWAAELHRMNIVEGGVWDARALDQYVWENIMWNNVWNSTTYSFWPHYRQNGSHYEATFNKTGWASRTRNEVVYRLSAQWFQNKCFSECGFVAPNQGFGSRREELPKEQQGKALPNHKQRIVCEMPKASWERMVSVHFNCMGESLAKRDLLLAYIGATYDEDAFKLKSGRVGPADPPEGLPAFTPEAAEEMSKKWARGLESSGLFWHEPPPPPSPPPRPLSPPQPRAPRKRMRV